MNFAHLKSSLAGCTTFSLKWTGGYGRRRIALSALIPPQLKNSVPCDDKLPLTIILHGLLGSANNWRSLLAREDMLAGRFVCALDLRNHGKSEHSDSMTYKEMACDVIEFVDKEHRVRDISVVGHSMGGKVAMHLALAFPERISNLVVVDIAPVSYSGTLMHSAIIEGMSSMDLKSIKNLTQARAALEGIIPNLETREFVLTNLIQHPVSKEYMWKVNIDALRTGLGEGYLSDFSPPQTTPFQGPCLWIKGGKSRYIDPSAHTQVMRRYFPKVELHTIPTAGHWPHHETPQEFLDIINPWFTTHARKLR